MQQTQCIKAIAGEVVKSRSVHLITFCGGVQVIAFKSATALIQGRSTPFEKTMRILITLSLFISVIAFGQENSGIDIINSEQTLVGNWEFVKTLDQNGKKIKKITLDRNTPDGKPITLNANGPDIIIKSDGTYTKIFTPENSDYGVWRIKSSNEIEYEMVIPENSRQGQLIIQTQKFFPDKKWRKDEKGNFLDASTDRIIELTESEMKVEYEKNYILIYKKTAE